MGVIPIMTATRPSSDGGAGRAGFRQQVVTECLQPRLVGEGRELNLALASKVNQLARYRSEFFGKLREILAIVRRTYCGDLGVQYISINVDATIYMQACEGIAKALK